jgi:hypothetical protein
MTGKTMRITVTEWERMLAEIQRLKLSLSARDAVLEAFRKRADDSEIIAENKRLTEALEDIRVTLCAVLEHKP